MRLALALLSAAMVAGCKVEADFSGDLPIKTLSAEAYMQEIATVDQLLFRESPLGDDGVRSLESTLESTAKRVAESDPNSKFLKIESLELRLLAKRAGRLSPQGTGKALQDNWMRIRNNLFDDRAWFARSAADLDYEAKAVSQPAPPPSTVAAPTPVAIAAPEPETEQRLTLSGRWKVVSVVANGELREDPELSGSTVNFELPRMTVVDGTGKTKTYSYSIDNGYLFLIGPEGAGWAKYDINSEGLRMAFYDGLKGKPESFVWSGQRDPMLIFVRLVALR